MRLCATFSWLWLMWLASGEADEPKIICVYENWAVDEVGYARLDPSEIDPSLCTHLIYSLVGVTEDGDVDIWDPPWDLPDDGGKAGFQKLNALRKRNEKLKTLVRSDGLGESSETYSKIAADPALRSKYVKNVVNFVLRHEFDGFDIFWQGLNEDGRSPHNVGNFVLLLKELRASFDPHKLILSSKVQGTEEEAKLFYDIPQISKYLDLIILNIDPYSPELTTGHNTPLYPAARETSSLDRSRNINASVHYWMDQGAPVKKLILGTRFFGLSYILNNSAEHAPGSPASGFAEYELDEGLASYSEICRLISLKSWTSVWDEEQRVPYSYGGDRWISYDNAVSARYAGGGKRMHLTMNVAGKSELHHHFGIHRSMSEKGEYVRTLGLGGVEAWSIVMDDHRGDCGERYPLLNALNRKLRGNGSRPVSTSGASPSTRAKIVCHYVSSAIKKIGYARLDPGKIDPNLCTHLVYWYVSITEDGNVGVVNPLADLPDNGGKAGFQKFNGLRKRNRKLKTLVSTGGEIEGRERYWKVASNTLLRSKYVKNVVDFLHRHEFDGLELSWQFPTNSEDLPDAVGNFVLLLKDLRASFDEHNLVLSISVKQFEVYTKSYFNIYQISSYVNSISLNIIYHTFADPTTGHGVPLYSATREKTTSDRSLNINATVQYWLQQGAPAEKLLISTKFHGMSLILNNSAEHVPGSPAIVPEAYRPDFGYVEWSEICLLTVRDGWSTVWDEEQRVPYSYSGTQWITYDNVRRRLYRNLEIRRSLTEKGEYVKAMGLGGVAAWFIEQEDHWGECGERYPLLKTLNRVLKENGSSSVSTPEGLQSTGGNVVCYYSSWTLTLFDYRRLEPSEIDPNLCTHLIYGNVGITEDGDVRVWDPWIDLPDKKGYAGFRKFNDLRKRNERLKTLVSTGGKLSSSEKYSTVAADASLRSKYAKNVVDFVLRHEFDGFDIFWQWPTISGDNSDVENFVLLLKELRANFDQHKLILSIQVDGSEKSARLFYDIPQISKYVDFILMGMIFHVPWGSVTGHSAPLYPAARETSSEDLTLNIDAAVKYWLTQGAPAKKIILGTRFYGIVFDLDDSLDHLPGSPADSRAGSPPWGRYLGYNGICRLTSDDDVWSTDWDEEQRVPYSYSGHHWISYDNAKSLTEKGQYAKAMGLGGVMASSIDLDDHRGDYGRRFPLLNALNRGIREIGSSSELPSSAEIASQIKPDSELPSIEAKIICYLRNVAIFDPVYQKLDPSEMDSNLCTHLIYLWVDITDDGEVRVADPRLDLPDNGGYAGFQKLNALREKNNELKTLISTAGDATDSPKYSKVVADASLRTKYVKNVVDFVLRHKFDGFDIRWQYPNKDGDSPDDVQNYVILLKELRENFDQHKLILSVILTGAEVNARKYYDIPQISKYVDFILLDIECHTLWETKISHLSPLLPAARETSAHDRSLNYHASINYWLDQGVPREKLILGTTMYGISYPLNNPAEHEPGSAVSDDAESDSRRGLLEYHVVCRVTSQDGWTTDWDEEQRVPYSYAGNRWISYDNVRSFTEKAKYVRAMGLGGVMVWTIDMDDMHGKCGERRPLLKALNRVLRSSGSGSDSEPEVNTTTKVDTTADEEAKRICTKLSIKYVRHPQNCAKFWICLKIKDNEFHAEPFSCGKGLNFDTSKTVCRSKELVDCS